MLLAAHAKRIAIRTRSEARPFTALANSTACIICCVTTSTTPVAQSNGILRRHMLRCVALRADVCQKYSGAAKVAIPVRKFLFCCFALGTIHMLSPVCALTTATKPVSRPQIWWFICSTDRYLPARTAMHACINRQRVRVLAKKARPCVQKRARIWT